MEDEISTTRDAYEPTVVLAHLGAVAVTYRGLCADEESATVFGTRGVGCGRS